MNNLPFAELNEKNMLDVFSECKYLRITISEKTCNQDIHRQMIKFYSNANILLRRFLKCSVDVKYYLFKM